MEDNIIKRKNEKKLNGIWNLNRKIIDIKSDLEIIVKDVAIFKIGDILVNKINPSHLILIDNIWYCEDDYYTYHIWDDCYYTMFRVELEDNYKICKDIKKLNDFRKRIK